MTAGGLERLLNEAASRYPHNAFFARWKRTEDQLTAEQVTPEAAQINERIEEGAWEDTFERSQDKLGSPIEAIRLDGLRQLRKLADTCPGSRDRIKDFLRNYVKRPPGNDDEVLRRAMEWLCLQGVVLGKIHYKGVNLGGAHLRGAKLKGARFTNASRLAQVDLREADLSDADLRGVDLRGADLRNANLPGARFSGRGEGATNLKGAKLNGADLRNVENIFPWIESAHGDDQTQLDPHVNPPSSWILYERPETWNERRGRQPRVIDADLREIDLKGLDFNRVVFVCTDLRGKDLRGLNFSHARFDKVDLREANLSGANLQGAELHGAQLSGADLDGADLREAKLGDEAMKAKNLERAKLVGVTIAFGEVDFTGKDFSGVDFSGATLQGRLEGGKFSGACLRSATLNSNTSRGVELVDLQKADLQDAKLSGFFYRADFRGADLKGADFSSVGREAVIPLRIRGSGDLMDADRVLRSLVSDLEELALNVT